MGCFFKNGTFEQDLVEAYGSTDMMVLAIIERAHVEVGGRPDQDWALRVTLVYRDRAEWHLAHRHADPLVSGVSAVGLAVMRAASTRYPRQQILAVRALDLPALRTFPATSVRELMD